MRLIFYTLTNRVYIFIIRCMTHNSNLNLIVQDNITFKLFFLKSKICLLVDKQVSGKPVLINCKEKVSKIVANSFN